MEKNVLPSFRKDLNPYGTKRVLNPKGVFPQAADSLDTSLPIYQDEILIEVDCLNLDSASFHQISEESGGDPNRISKKIHQIVSERGKMQNPVTGSGGMLVGKVIQKGEKSPHPYQVGERIATLVSLTLTPLQLEKIHSIDLKGAQVRVSGYAILFSNGVAAPIPQDMEESTALAILDVCGAPAWVKRLVRSEDKVLIMGLGKAGILSALAAQEKLPPESLWVTDVRDESVERALKTGLNASGFAADAKDPLGFQEKLKNYPNFCFDLVVNTCNVPETEMSTLLALRPKGRILFFNMATQFSRAVLSAEGLGLDAEMIMGNGYAEGHWQLALDLVRRNLGFKKWF